MSATSRVLSHALRQDAGTVTVEAAIALCAFVAVLVMVFAGLSAVLNEIRCTDAAREAARLVARGEPERARQAVHHIAPGATVTINADGDSATVVVTAAAAGMALPGLRVSATAYAVLEPGVEDQVTTDSPVANSLPSSAAALRRLGGVTSTVTSTPAPGQRAPAIGARV